jgi:hypothetical protein
VNKSRAQWRAMVSKIPVTVDDVEKIPQISNDIKNMLKSNANIFLGKEAPYCYLSRIESSFAELTLGCNLKQMVSSNLPHRFFLLLMQDRKSTIMLANELCSLADFHLYLALIL